MGVTRAEGVRIVAAHRTDAARVKILVKRQWLPAHALGRPDLAVEHQGIGARQRVVPLHLLGEFVVSQRSSGQPGLQAGTDQSTFGRQQRAVALVAYPADCRRNRGVVAAKYIDKIQVPERAGFIDAKFCVFCTQAESEIIHLGQRDAVAHAPAESVRGVITQTQQGRVGAAVENVEAAADPIHRVVGVGVAQADIAVDLACAELRGDVFAAAKNIVLRNRTAQYQLFRR